MSSDFLTRSDTNLAVEPQKMARGLKCWIQEEAELYYLCSKNKGADQLRGYRAADLHFCFCVCKKQISQDEDQISINREQGPVV